MSLMIWAKLKSFIEKFNEQGNCMERENINFED